MKSLNYRMLVMARESRGLTQSQLSNSIFGLTQGNLSKMEKGILNVTDDILERISAVLNYPTSFFYQDDPKSPIHSFYYRKRQSFPKRELSIIEAKMDIVRLVIDELISSVEIPSFNIPEIQPDGDITPESIARHIRVVMGIPKGPIQKPIEYIEKAGVLVYFLDFDSEKFDGITLYTNSGYPIIFINSKMPNDRKRFTLGHELGHLVMHIPFTDLKDPDIIEKEANRFSAEFNMPEMDCRNDLLGLRYVELDDLKMYWKMSKASIIFKAKELNLISESTYRYMNIELSRRGERKKEKINVNLDEPTLIRSIIYLHKNELGYTNSELSEISKLSISDFSEYFLSNLRTLKIA